MLLSPQGAPPDLGGLARGGPTQAVISPLRRPVVQRVPAEPGRQGSRRRNRESFCISLFRHGVTNRNRPDSHLGVGDCDSESPPIGRGGKGCVVLQSKSDPARRLMGNIESPNPRPGPIVFARQIQNGPLPERCGIAHVAVQLREPFGIAPGTSNPPQVHFVGGRRAVNKIDPLTVGTPCKEVVVLVRAVLEYLTFV